MTSLLARHAAALTLAACVLAMIPGTLRAEELRVEHAQGVATLPDTPKTVLVFDLAALDTLDALGIDPQGVPSGVKPAHLRKFNEDRYEKIGSLFEPDLETVAAMAPDLIIIGGRSAAKYRELSAIAPTIDVSADLDHYLESAEERVLTLARVFDKEAEASRRLEALNTSVAALREKAKDAGTSLVILTTGGRMSAYGPGSRFGILHTAFGLEPAVKDLAVATHGQAISYEFILKADPEHLFVVDRDAAIGQKGQAARAMLDNDIVRRTKAWKEGKVTYLQPDTWYLGGTGLTAMQTMVDEVSAALD
ncbi:siderophore ABC transporter substrate-binding protein [Stappia sp.]|uniref:siderophore ABC transporter substrate-binding protein n=1 Tax=Stappia sp. TaxID=1870903 RepID=UPI003A9905A2